MTALNKVLLPIGVVIGMTSIIHASQEKRCHNFSGTYSIIAESCVGSDEFSGIQLPIALPGSWQNDAVGYDDTIVIDQKSCDSADLHIAYKKGSADRVINLSNSSEGLFTTMELSIDQQHLVSKKSVFFKTQDSTASWDLLQEGNKFFLYTHTWASHFAGL